VLVDYNAIIWICGDAADSLTSWDITNLTAYLGISGSNLWLIGKNALGNVIDAFEQDYLGIGAIAPDTGNPSNLSGVKEDPISHGIRYEMLAGTGADTLVPTPSAVGMLRKETQTGDVVGIRLDGGVFRTVTTAFGFGDIMGGDQRQELTYLVMHWFGMPDERVELRLSAMDITISSAHPQLGSAYVIQASLRNAGGSGGNALVRFLDGTTQIGSDAVSVNADGKTTAEVIWIPLFAGWRTITVQADPLGEQPEVFEWFNNNATHSLYVYFFYDDMESGAGKWRHESTVMLIEAPLDPYMNIVSAWNATESQYLEHCADPGFYHTYDTAAWLQEPAGATGTTKRIPIDVVFALDTSGSMLGTPITNLRDATKNFIGQLTAEDRAAIWTFGSDTETYPRDVDTTSDDRDPYLRDDNPAGEGDLTWAYMTPENKTRFNTTIDTFTATGYTPFYDTLGAAAHYALTFDPTASDNSRFEYVIGMTDGESNDDEVDTPNTDWGSTITESQYAQTGLIKNGLVKAPMMIYTIGLLDSADHDPSYPTAPGWSRTPPSTSYPLEYDLWHVADSSPWPEGKYGVDSTTGEPFVGHYYYTTDSSQLSNIFQNIFESIQQVQAAAENVTRSGDITPSSAGTGTGTRSIAPPETMATIWSDDFESGDFSNWDGAPAADWIVRANGAGDYGTQPVTPHGGTYCANGADQDGADNILEKTLNLAGWINVNLTFWWDAQDIEAGQEVTLDIYDGSWNYGVRSYDGDDGDYQTDAVDWQLETVDLSGYSMIDGFIIRFTAPLEMDDVEGTGLSRWFRDDEFMLDDVLLTGDSGGGPDTTPPTVSSTIPLDGATGVAIDQAVSVIFSETMDTTHGLEPTLTQTGGTIVAFTFAGWSTTFVVDDTATWTHAANWGTLELETLRVSGGQDLAGNTLDGDNDGVSEGSPTDDYSWSFTTGAGATATATGPIGTSNVSAITLTYTWVGTPTSVNLYYTTNGGTTWNFIGND
ncbi:MAG: Ig-like domain-containing protein, partial [Candidatus Thermoplasmatota archaeon]